MKIQKKKLGGCERRIEVLGGSGGGVRLVGGGGQGGDVGYGGCEPRIEGIVL